MSSARIDHIGIWTYNLEDQAAFYQKYFNAMVGPKYTNTAKGFSSIFLQFETGCRLELMTIVGLEGARTSLNPSLGFAHIAIGVGSIDTVNILTETLRNDGFRILNEPRTTGDGYYESVVLDPDWNRIEITV